MTAILQLSGAKRTYLPAKISSNLRPLTLERRRARKGEGPLFFRPPPPPLVVFAEKLFGERRSRASISDNWPTSTRVLVSYPRIRFRGEADINWQVRPADSVANDPKRSSLTFVVPAYMMCSSVRAMIFARCDGERST